MMTTTTVVVMILAAANLETKTYWKQKDTS
jgi:hypothetical protein